MLRCDLNKKTRLWFLTVKSMSSRSDAFFILFLPLSHVNLLFVSLAWGFIIRNVMRATVITHVVCSRQREADLSASFSTKVEGTWTAHILDQMHLSICCEALYDDFMILITSQKALFDIYLPSWKVFWGSVRHKLTSVPLSISSGYILIKVLQQTRSHLLKAKIFHESFQSALTLHSLH